MLHLDESFKFRKRFKLWPITIINDVADYKIGWIFSIKPFITIIKVKTSKIMEAPKYITVIGIFGYEYILG